MGLGFNVYGGIQGGGQSERASAGPATSIDTDSALPLPVADAFRRAAVFQNFTARLERETDHNSGIVAVTILAWNQPGAKTEITAGV